MKNFHLNYSPVLHGTVKALEEYLLIFSMLLKSTTLILFSYLNRISSKLISKCLPHYTTMTFQTQLSLVDTAYGYKNLVRGKEKWRDMLTWDSFI